MTGRKILLRKVMLVLAVALSSTTLTACHELYCAFVEGLTGEPLDCSHDAFPDLGDIELPPLPPPPSLPTTTTTQPAGTTTTSTPSTSTTTSSTTSTSTTTPTSTTSTTVTSPTTMPGQSVAPDSVSRILSAGDRRGLDMAARTIDPPERSFDLSELAPALDG